MRCEIHDKEGVQSTTTAMAKHFPTFMELERNHREFAYSEEEG